MSLLTLPSELLSKILTFLPWKLLTPCLTTCKALHTIIFSDPQLIYERELCRAGMIDNPSSDHDVTTRIQKLREREARWLNFDPIQVGTISAPEGASWINDVDGGLYVLGRLRHPTAFIYTLPLDGATREAVHSSVNSGGDNLVDYAMATIELDLIAYLITTGPEIGPPSRQVEVSLQSTAHGLPHPGAATARLKLSTPGIMDGYIRSDLKICDDTIFIAIEYPMIGPTHCQLLYVYNWRTGQHKQPLRLSHVAFHGLSSNLVMIPSDEGFQVYRVPPFYDESRPALEIQAMLHLPSLHPTVSELNFQMRGQPSLLHPDGALNPQSRGNPYHPNPLQSIMMTIIEAPNQDNPMGTWNAVTLIFHRQTILRIIDNLLIQNASTFAEITPSLPWNDWGPQNTRIIDTNPIYNPFVTSCSGARWVTIQTSTVTFDSPPSSFRSMEIFDFSSERVRIARQKRLNWKPIETGYEGEFGIQRANRVIRLVDEESTYSVEPHCIFADDVVTRLPYIRTTYLDRTDTEYSQWVEDPQNVFDCRWQGAMMDSRHLLCMKREAESMNIYIPQQIDILYFG